MGVLIWRSDDEVAVLAEAHYALNLVGGCARWSDVIPAAEYAVEGIL